MKLLHVVASYAPAWRYGGPVQSVAALCQGLTRLGEDVTVYTTNVDGASDLAVPLGQPVVRHGVKVHYFQVQPPRHWSFSWALTRALEKEVANFDLVHLHGVFVYPALAAGFYCRKYGIPYFLSPRGMLCNVAYGMKSLRKRMYLALLERRNLNRSEEHTSELQSQSNLVCRLLLEKKKNNGSYATRLTGGAHLCSFLWKLRATATPPPTRHSAPQQPDPQTTVHHWTQSR